MRHRLGHFSSRALFLALLGGAACVALGCDDEPEETVDGGTDAADDTLAEVDGSDVPGEDSAPDADVVEDVPAGEPILLGGPMALTGPYAAEGEQCVWGANTAIDWINDVHGGVLVGGVRRPLEYVQSDDTSVATEVETITQQYCDNANVAFILAPYSTGLTLAAVPITEACDKLLLVPAGAAESIFADNPEWVVQVVTPGGSWHRGFLDLIVDVAEPGDLALAYEDDPFADSVHGPAATYAADLGFTIVFDTTYPAGALDADLDTYVSDLAATNPDVILGGGHFLDGNALTRVLADQGVEPQALSLLVAASRPDYYETVDACPDPCDYANHPGEGVSAPAQWVLGVTYNQADTEEAGMAWFGPSQEEFLELFHATAGADNEPSQSAGGYAAAILALAMAIELADSLDTTEVRAALGDLEVVTLYGAFDVDETGLQVGHEMVDVQWQEGEMVIVSPGRQDR
jgi:branched-chain amino acid transport system substrate-binding protein